MEEDSEKLIAKLAIGSYSPTPLIITIKSTLNIYKYYF